jgi:hypothetical protein
VIYLFHPGRNLIGSDAPAVYQFLPPRVVTNPDLQAALPKEILVVEPQLFEAGPRYAGEF